MISGKIINQEFEAENILLDGALIENSKLYSFRNRNCQNVTVKYPAVPIMRLIR
jgi:hypothetical protein